MSLSSLFFPTFIHNRFLCHMKKYNNEAIHYLCVLNYGSLMDLKEKEKHEYYPPLFYGLKTNYDRNIHQWKLFWKIRLIWKMYIFRVCPPKCDVMTRKYRIFNIQLNYVLHLTISTRRHGLIYVATFFGSVLCLSLVTRHCKKKEEERETKIQ